MVMRYMGGGVGHTIVTRVEEDNNDAGDVPIEVDEPPGDINIVFSDSEDEGEAENIEGEGEAIVDLGAEDGEDEDDGYEGFAPL